MHTIIDVVTISLFILIFAQIIIIKKSNNEINKQTSKIEEICLEIDLLKEK